MKAWLYFITFGVVIAAQVAYCSLVLNADMLDLLVISMLSVAGGAALAKDLLMGPTT